jgi:hypothetical protein
MIINMADRLKDAEDLKLDALFRSDPVDDDGFSARIESLVRRRQWVRRLTFPAAFVIGAAIAAKPVMQLASLVPEIFAVVPRGLLGKFELPIAGLFETPLVLLAIVLIGATLMIGRMLEET